MRPNLAVATVILIVGACVVVLLSRHKDGNGNKSHMRMRADIDVEAVMTDLTRPNRATKLRSGEKMLENHPAIVAGAGGMLK